MTQRKDPLLSFRISPRLLERLDHHWRYRTHDRTRTDTARRALEVGLAELERTEAPDADAAKP